MRTEEALVVHERKGNCNSRSLEMATSPHSEAAIHSDQLKGEDEEVVTLASTSLHTNTNCDNLGDNDSQEEASYENLQARVSVTMSNHCPEEATYEKLLVKCSDSNYESSQRVDYEKLQGRATKDAHESLQEEANYHKLSSRVKENRSDEECYEQMQAINHESMDEPYEIMQGCVYESIYENSPSRARRELPELPSEDNSRTNRTRVWNNKLNIAKIAAIVVVASLLVPLTAAVSFAITQLNTTREANKLQNGSISDSQLVCNSLSGAWKRVAYFSLPHNAIASCPEELSYVDNPPSCVRSSHYAGCSTVMIPTNGLNYSHICGRINGLQSGSPDGFLRSGSAELTLNDNFVDGGQLCRWSYFNARPRRYRTHMDIRSEQQKQSPVCRLQHL